MSSYMTGDIIKITTYDSKFPPFLEKRRPKKLLSNEVWIPAFAGMTNISFFFASFFFRKKKEGIKVFQEVEV